MILAFLLRRLRQAESDNEKNVGARIAHTGFQKVLRPGNLPHGLTTYLCLPVSLRSFVFLLSPHIPPSPDGTGWRHASQVGFLSDGACG